MNYKAFLKKGNNQQGLSFSPVPGFGVTAFFVPDMGGGLRGGGFPGFGAPVMQYDPGGPDNPVMAEVPGIGIIEIPRFLLFAVPPPKIS